MDALFFAMCLALVVLCAALAASWAGRAADPQPPNGPAPGPRPPNAPPAHGEKYTIIPAPPDGWAAAKSGDGLYGGTIPGWGASD